MQGYEWLPRYKQQAAGGISRAIKESRDGAIETITKPVALQRKLTALLHIPHRPRKGLGANSRSTPACRPVEGFKY